MADAEVARAAGGVTAGFGVGGFRVVGAEAAEAGALRGGASLDDDSGAVGAGAAEDGGGSLVSLTLSPSHDERPGQPKLGLPSHTWIL